MRNEKLEIRNGKKQSSYSSFFIPHSAFLIALLLLVAGCQQPPGGKKPEPAPPARQVEPEFESEFDSLVWLLSSSNFDRRREAHKKLFANGKAIIPALEDAALKAKSRDHRHQIQIVIDALRTRKKKEKRDLLVTLSAKSKSFEPKSPVEMTFEIKNTGDVPLKLIVPLLRKRSVTFRLDWTADFSFVSGGRKQPFSASGTNRDELLKSGWNPTTATVRPGESIKESMDITDMCRRPARYTAVATYRWVGVGDFMSNAVTFEIKKPPAEKEEPKKENEDN